MEFLVEYGAFLLKAITIVVSILIVVGGIISLSARPKSQADGELVIKKLNDELEDHKEQLEDAILDKELLKKMAKDKKKDDKQKEKSAKKAAKTKTEDEPEEKKRVFVLDFDGDIKASEVELLRHEISAILTMASLKDEVVVTLESGGGMVHSYGLASSQLQRIRDKNIPLTICVDKVAASGGYMMACLADKVVAAPFAIIGSIGVVAQLPNFNRLLKKHDVDFELFTAGEYKRTVTMFGHNSAKAKDKFQSDLEDTHELFKDHVARYRKDLNVEAVATGDIWYGQQALENGLIDEVGTSDQYLMNACDESDVFTVRYEYKKTLQEKLGIAVQQGAESAFTRLLTAANNRMQSKG